jgi:hypothetical protein
LATDGAADNERLIAWIEVLRFNFAFRYNLLRRATQMHNFVKMPLSAVPVEWQTALAECEANFKVRWDGLISERTEAAALGDRKRIERIDFEISQMMAASNGEVGDKIGDKTIVGRIVGGPNGFAIFSDEFVNDRSY